MWYSNLKNLGSRSEVNLIGTVTGYPSIEVGERFLNQGDSTGRKLPKGNECACALKQFTGSGWSCNRY
ncbi:hypothetical protein PghCCS26_62130 [Paenibacillus glycanilyticus]|uniref:Uncharacterized protein n=1 Tax=Paenibacillus glycanilyticus TaxID=126569 RepID=A0ABQ6NW42_9BACL|nr:hypothetical protein PghCCS26_62130 [Paenibacillus glycanilyticus]